MSIKASFVFAPMLVPERINRFINTGSHFVVLKGLHILKTLRANIFDLLIKGLSFILITPFYVFIITR